MLGDAPAHIPVARVVGRVVAFKFHDSERSAGILKSGYAPTPRPSDQEGGRSRRRNHGIANRRAFRQRTCPGDAPRPDECRRPTRAWTRAQEKPAAFFTAAAASLITCGNFETTCRCSPPATGSWKPSPRISTIKRDLWTARRRSPPPGSILSTNTSGIPLALIAEGLPDEFRRQFPRHALLQSAALSAPLRSDSRSRPPIPLLLAGVSRFRATAAWAKASCSARTRPTSSPIASAASVGLHTFTSTRIEDDYTVEEVDALTGSLIGLPNSASFRLIDIVGLDIWAYRRRAISTTRCRTIPGASASSRPRSCKR